MPYGSSLPVQPPPNAGICMTLPTQSSQFEALRRKAESIIDSALDLTREEDVQDIKELLHQLQVYQIELELQNEELVTTRAELEASRNKYIKLFDFAPIGYFIFDQEGLLRDANLYGASLLGVDRNYLQNKPFIAYVSSDFQQAFFSHRRQAFADNLPQFCELKLKARGGRERYIHMHSIVIKDGEEARCLSAVVDFTEQKRTEEALKVAKAEAEKANLTKSEFLARMSHEIRTPLHGILGMTDVALKSLGESALANTEPSTIQEVQPLLRMAKQSAVSLLHIVNDILDISKVETGVLTLDEAPFQFAEAVNNTLSPFVFEARQKGIEFTVFLDPDIPETLLGDAPRLQQVLVNLAGNAVKFTKSGLVEVAVRSIRRAKRGEIPGVLFEDHASDAMDRLQLVFTIKDTGIGIPEDQLPKVFDNFYQVDGSLTREFEGTGLGLAISKHLVQMMGGEIWAESMPGRGSAFSFTAWLGVTQEPTKTAAEQEAAWQLTPHEPAGKAMQDADTLPALQILLAEDNLVNQAFAQLILKREGHNVTTVPNGLDALRILATQSFDIVLMDVRMPEMDGVEATRRIRTGLAKVQDPNVPIIAMTAHSQMGDRERFLKAGMDGYISKPMTWGTVIETIRKVMQEKGRLA